MKTFFRILGFATSKRKFVLLYAVMAGLSVIFSLINFTAIIPILEVLFNQVEPDSTLSADDSLKVQLYNHLFELISREGKKTALLLISSIIVVSVLLANVFRYLADLLTVRLRADIIQSLRSSLFDAILVLPLSFLDQNRRGDVISRMTTDIQEIETSIIYALKVFMKEPLMILGYTGILFFISPKLALISLVLIPISGLLISSLARKLKKKAADSQEVLAEVSFNLDEALHGLRAIKSFNAQDYVRGRFHQTIKRYAEYNQSMGKRFQLAGPLSEFLGVTTMVLILIIGGSMVLDQSDSLKAAEFIGFLIIFSQLLAPAKALSQANSLAQRGIASGDRVFELMDNLSSIPQGFQSISQFNQTIVLENVSFRYNQHLVLNKVDLSLEKGKTYALVGPSGSGKSTLADMIPRFHDPTEGRVMIDGQDLKSTRTAELRDLISIVSQDPILFNDTVLNNLTLNREIPEEEIINASKLANAHHFITKLPDGYLSPISDRGSNLSGGEKQRIAIARAILKDAPILILDEATSALDANDDKEIRDALRVLMLNRTSLIITHRLSTVEYCDHIIVLENGVITHSGSHSELSEKDGYYKKTLEKVLEMDF